MEAAYALLVGESFREWHRKGCLTLFQGTCTYRHVFSDVLAPAQRLRHMWGHVQTLAPSYTFHPVQPNLVVFQGLDLFPAVQGLRSQLFLSQPPSRAPCLCCTPRNRTSWFGVDLKNQLLPMGWTGWGEAAFSV